MPVIGLKNIGNTCFMNSALQLVLNCDYLNDALLNTHCSEEIISTYKDLVIEYRNSKSAIVPRKIKNVLSSKCNQFIGFYQEDSHEFVALLLGRMEKELRLKNKKDNTMGNILDMKVTITVRSTESNMKSSHNEILTILPLDLPNDNRDIELKDCIDDYTSIQQIDGKVEFEEKTADGKRKKSKENGNQQLTITGSGKYILIQLKRFVQNAIGRYSKKVNKVHSPLVMDTSFGTYNLKSFIVQMGSMGGGHYISFIKDKNTWKCADDSNISIVEDNHIKELVKCAYMLCYEREE